MYSLACVLTAFILTILSLMFIIVRLLRQTDLLTSKLMARDYREFAAFEQCKQNPPPEPTEPEEIDQEDPDAMDKATYDELASEVSSGYHQFISP